jgi:predicted nucleotidyltransferase
MDMKKQWLAALTQWAGNNDNILALWVFGSRVKGMSHPQSDIDIALELMPPTGKHNWALAAYVEFFDEWKGQLAAAVAWKVSLIAIGADSDLDEEVRKTGRLIWRREWRGGTDVG